MPSANEAPMTPCQWYTLLLLEEGYKPHVAHLCPRGTLTALFARQWIDNALDVTTHGEIALNVERARKGILRNELGVAGVRDPENPCSHYTKEPGACLTRDCEGDGHYLCETCVLWREYEVADIPEGH